jgi:hypothetical protein
MITREEACLMFQKWHTEGTRLLLVGSFYGWSLQLQGKISAASENEIKFDPLDAPGRIVLDLDQPDLGFEYAEPKDAPPHIRQQVPEYGRNLGTLGVSLPLRFFAAQYQQYEQLQRVPKREKLLFMEVPGGGFPLESVG